MRVKGIVNNKWIQMFLYVCLSVLFLFSVVTKVSSIVLFEVSLFASQVPLMFTEIVARVIIIIELVLGIWLFFSIFSKDKRPLLFSFLLMLFFDFFLVKEVLMGDSKQNCGCFGDVLEMSTEQALFKNILTQLLILPFLLWQEITKFFRLQIGLVLLTIVSVTVMISFPIENVFEQYEGRNESQIKSESIENVGLNSLSPELKKIILVDNQFLVFVHYGCGHCKDFVQYLELLKDKGMLPLTRIIMFGEQEKVDIFLTETNMKLPYSVIDKESHLITCRGRFPSVFLYVNNSLHGRWSRTDFVPNEILKKYGE